MIKLITPPGMLFTTALLVIYAFYAFSIGTIEDSMPLLAGGTLAILATYGAAMVRPWSRYLVYALTAGFVAKLGYSIYSGIDSGFFQYQFGEAGAIVRSLIPSVVMTVLSAVCCVIVHRQFRSRSPALEQSG